MIFQLAEFFAFGRDDILLLGRQVAQSHVFQFTFLLQQLCLRRRFLPRLRSSNLCQRLLQVLSILLLLSADSVQFLFQFNLSNTNVEQVATEVLHHCFRSFSHICQMRPYIFPSSTWLLGPHKYALPSSILTGATVFAWLKSVMNRQTRPCYIIHL